MADKEMLLSFCTASVVAIIMKCPKIKMKKLAELRNHVFWSHVGLSTHINTFSKFHSNTAAVSVTMLVLSTKLRDTKFENHWSMSFNMQQLVERNRLKLYSVQQRSTAAHHVERHKLFQHSTIHDTLYNISWAHLLLNKY